MLSESVSANKKLSEVIVAGVIFTVLSVLIATLWAMFSYKQVLDMRAEYSMLKDSVNRLRTVQAIIGNRVPQQDIAATLPVATTTATEPVKKEATTIKEQLSPATTEPKPEPPPAAKTVNPAVAKVKTEEPKAASKNVVISYYYRRADNASLPETLRGLGYKFELKKMEKNSGYEKTNCIWFGAGVPVADVKKVAIALIQSGNPVKGIKKFPLSRKNSSYKRNIIEVGMDPNLDNYSSRPLSIVEVERARKF